MMAISTAFSLIPIFFIFFTNFRQIDSSDCANFCKIAQNGVKHSKRYSIPAAEPRGFIWGILKQFNSTLQLDGAFIADYLRTNSNNISTNAEFSKASFPGPINGFTVNPSFLPLPHVNPVLPLRNIRPQHFKVHLDLPVSKRWEKVLLAFNGTGLFEKLKGLATFLTTPSAGANNGKSIGPELEKIYEKVYEKDKHLHEYFVELQGMRKYLNENLGVNISAAELMTLNLLYELIEFAGPGNNHFLPTKMLYGANQSIIPVQPNIPSIGCTSLVAKMPDGRGVLHGRNLDFGATELLKDATIIVDFMRGGRIQYTAVTFVLYNGVVTGQKPNAFTLALNAKYGLVEAPNRGMGEESLIQELTTRFQNPVAYVIREALEKDTSYEDAIIKLKKHAMVPCYIIIGGMGANEGAIITRMANGSTVVSRIGEAKGDEWFISETNFDHWEPAGDIRRNMSYLFMNKIGPERISAENLFQNVLTNSQRIIILLCNRR